MLIRNIIVPFLVLVVYTVSGTTMENANLPCFVFMYVGAIIGIFSVFIIFVINND